MDCFCPRIAIYLAKPLEQTPLAGKMIDARLKGNGGKVDPFKVGLACKHCRTDLEANLRVVCRYWIQQACYPNGSVADIVRHWTEILCKVGIWVCVIREIYIHEVRACKKHTRLLKYEEKTTNELRLPSSFLPYHDGR